MDASSTSAMCYRHRRAIVRQRPRDLQRQPWFADTSNSAPVLADCAGFHPSSAAASGCTRFGILAEPQQVPASAISVSSRPGTAAAGPVAGW